MEFDINREIKEQTYEDKYFSEYINGISYYDPNRIDKNTYIITQKSIDNISIWIKNNPKTPWKDIDSNVYKFIKIYDDTKYEIMYTNRSIWNTIKTMCLLYFVKQTRDKSKLSIFKDITKVKCELINVVRLKTQEEYKKQLRNIKEQLISNNIKNKNESKNIKQDENLDIYSMYLNLVKDKYSQKIKTNYCYIYLYHNLHNEKEIIVYPEEIKTLEDMKIIIEVLYLRNINMNYKHKLLHKEKYQYLIETIIILDKYSDKYTTQKLNIFVNKNNNIKTIEKTLNFYGYQPYDKVQDFSKLIQKINSDIPIIINERKKRTKKNTQKDKLTNKPTLIKKEKKYDDNNSTVVSDSEDETEDDITVENMNNKDHKKTVTKTSINVVQPKKQNITSSQDKINKSIGEFIKNNIKKKKESFISITQIYDAYKTSKEFKTTKLNKDLITRAMIRNYLNKYKWVQDNFKEKHKDIRSVIMNYILM
jgi:hypothetical protein